MTIEVMLIMTVKLVFKMTVKMILKMTMQKVLMMTMKVVWMMTMEKNGLCYDLTVAWLITVKLVLMIPKKLTRVEMRTNCLERRGKRCTGRLSNWDYNLITALRVFSFFFFFLHFCRKKFSLVKPLRMTAPMCAQSC